MLDIRYRQPGREEKSQRHHAFPRQPAVEQRLPPLVVIVRAVGAGSERGSDVLQVVPHDAATVLGDHGVERVPRLHVRQIGPGAEHLQGPQLAPVLVRDDVVGVVRAGAVVAERTDRTPGHAARGHGAIRPVRAAMRPRENVVEVAPFHPALAPRRGSDLRRFRDRDPIRRHGHEMVLHLPVPERPEDLVRDHDRAGRGLGMSGRVEGDEPDLAARVADREAGRGAGDFSRHHGPWPRCWPAAGERTARDIVRGHRCRNQTVGEPVRIRHLVDRVDVARAHVGRRIAGMAEHVDREIDGQVDVPRLYLRGILGVGLARQGIVAEETPFGAGQQRRAHGQEPAEGQTRQESSGCGHDQNAALAANTRCRPSAPRATSTRSGVCTGP